MEVDSDANRAPKDWQERVQAQLAQHQGLPAVLQGVASELRCTDTLQRLQALTVRAFDTWLQHLTASDASIAEKILNGTHMTLAHVTCLYVHDRNCPNSVTVHGVPTWSAIGCIHMLQLACDSKRSVAWCLQLLHTLAFSISPKLRRQVAADRDLHAALEELADSCHSCHDAENQALLQLLIDWEYCFRSDWP